MLKTIATSKQNARLREVINMLQKAVKAQDKKKIAYAYDLAETINLDDTDTELFIEYDLLVSDANNILLA